MKKYLLVGGTVASSDGDRHHVSARDLVELYGIDPAECILLEEDTIVLGGVGLLRPFPRDDGRYDLLDRPAPAWCEDAHTDPDLYGLLAGVCSSPDDDTPRLMYADRLDELGRPGYAARAEFIRLQMLRLPKWGAGPPVVGPQEPKVIEGTELDGTGLPGGRWAAWARGRDLLRSPCPGSRFASYVAWAEPWRQECVLGYEPTPADFAVPGWAYRRGFVGDVVFRPADWLRVGDSVSWHSAADARCVHCPDKDGRQHNPYPGGWQTCVACRGTGYAPRPCPVTAHPVRRVTLTARVTAETRGGSSGADPRMGPAELQVTESRPGLIRLPGRRWRSWRELGEVGREDRYVEARLLALEWPSVREWVIEGLTYRGAGA